MKRRNFLKQFSLTAVSIAALGSKGLSEDIKPGNKTSSFRVDGKRYNVVFILVDQWRYCTMSHGYHHDKVVKTPNLDKLAKKGAHWQWCYAANPLCTPNRASLITGKYGHQIPVDGTPLVTGEWTMEYNDSMMHRDERCIAHEFTDAGYNCYYLGKWHMNGQGKSLKIDSSDQFPFGYVHPGWQRRGFTKFEGFNRGHNYWYRNTYMMTDEGVPMKGDGRFPDDTYEPKVQTSMAIDFIKENKKAPFFCMLSWGPPHGPYGAHPAEFDYNPDDMVFRPNVAEGDKNAKANANYFAHCTAMDVEVGRLMDTLQQQGLADNTLIVFTADHGDSRDSHGLGAKPCPIEESCHIPLLMCLPGKIKPGQVITNTVNTVDLMPIVLSLCGLNIPDTCTGKDKSPLLLGKSMPEESIYSAAKDRWRLVKKDNFKLIVQNVDGQAVHSNLYDLAKDPYELNNLLNNSDYNDIKTDLIAEYNSWRQRTGDSFPVPNGPLL
jgi:arylsulfatase A-like enzyme